MTTMGTTSNSTLSDMRPGAVRYNPQRCRYLTLITLVCFGLITLTGCLRRIDSQAKGEKTEPSKEATPQPCKLPAPDTYVTDYVNVLDQSAKDGLESKLKQLRSSGKIDFAVVLIETTGGQNIRDYSLDLANCWNVGGTNDDKAGITLLIAINDRKWHIQISRVLEQVLTNDEVYQIGNQMTPDFKVENYAGGVNRCVDAMIDVLSKRRKFSISNTNEKALVSGRVTKLRTFRGGRS